MQLNQAELSQLNKMATQTQSTSQLESGKEYKIVGHPRLSDEEIHPTYLGEKNGRHYFSYNDKYSGTIIATILVQSTIVEDGTVRIKPHSTLGIGLVNVDGIKCRPEYSGLLKILGELGVAA